MWSDEVDAIKQDRQKQKEHNEKEQREQGKLMAEYVIGYLDKHKDLVLEYFQQNIENNRFASKDLPDNDELFALPIFKLKQTPRSEYVLKLASSIVSKEVGIVCKIYFTHIVGYNYVVPSIDKNYGQSYQMGEEWIEFVVSLP